MINQILFKKLINRLYKISQIKTHIWFKDFNWEDLISLKMIPPYQPTLSTDNYESTEGIVQFMENPKKFKLVDKVERYTYLQETTMLLTIVAFIIFGKIL